jgi:carboxylesterase
MFSRRAVADRFERERAARLPLGPDGIVIGAQPYRLTASPTHAVLLVHGFNDTPQSLAPLAQALHAGGWTVAAPLLPGHGRDLVTMASQSRAAAWTAEVHRAYAELRATHDTVVLCGLSMGGALCALLAATLHDLPALVLLAPYLGMPWSLQLQLPIAWLAQLLTPYLAGRGGERSIHDPVARAKALGPGINTARTLTELRTIALAAERALTGVRAPTLYLQSLEDNRVTETSARHHFAMLGSTIREQRWLTGCGHIISADYCRAEVARQVIAWCDQYAGSPRAWGGIGNA